MRLEEQELGTGVGDEYESVLLGKNEGKYVSSLRFRSRKEKKRLFRTSCL